MRFEVETKDEKNRGMRGTRRFANEKICGRETRGIEDEKNCGFGED